MSLTVVSRTPWFPINEYKPRINERVIVRCVNPQAEANEPRIHVATTVYRPGSSTDWPYLAPHWASRVTHFMRIPDEPWGDAG
jgi:hypothetical protein